MWPAQIPAGRVIDDTVSFVDLAPTFLEAADGTAWSLEEFEKVGLRIALARYLFNQKAGIKIKDFQFPARVLGQPPLATGPTKDVTVDLELMVGEFLTEMGFDPETNAVSADLMDELNLARFA